VRVLNCYSAVSVEGRVAGVLLRVERLLLLEFLLGAVSVEALRLLASSVAAIFCQSGLGLAVGEF
jgi:hypothetical protein